MPEWLCEVIIAQVTGWLRLVGWGYSWKLMAEIPTSWLTNRLTGWQTLSSAELLDICMTSKYMTEALCEWLDDWLCYLPRDCLRDSLIEWLVDRLSDNFTDFGKDSMVRWWVDWVADQLKNWYRDCWVISDRLTGHVTLWLMTCLVVWLTGWLTGWHTE